MSFEQAEQIIELLKAIQTGLTVLTFGVGMIFGTLLYNNAVNIKGR